MNEETDLKGKMFVWLHWPLYLGILVILVNILIYPISIKAGIVMTLFTMVYLGTAVWFYVFRRSAFRRELLLFAMDYAQIQRQILTDLELPYGLADEKGKLLWMNTAMKELSKKYKIKKTIEDTFSGEKDGKENLAGGKNFMVQLEDRHFRVDMKSVQIPDELLSAESMGVSRDDIQLVAVYFYDETEKIVYQREIQKQKPVIGLIYLDNYEEALESIEEVRRSLLVALVERKINKYISNIGGISKKFEKDKFFIAIQQEHMDKVMEERFQILEDVRTVNIGNDKAVTLSIGFGMNGGSCNRNYEYARSAIDMALARGGDQAVVKDGENILYFGGKSQQQERNTRVKARVKAHALRELVETSGEILIMGHKMGDIDCFGAAVGVARAVMALQKKAHIVVDDITSSVRPMADRFINNTDYPEDLLISSSRALNMCDYNTLLVVVDVNRPSYTECPELLEKVSTIVVLDHHRQMRDSISHAVLSYVEPYASSACEMVAEILQYIGDGVRIKPVEADTMYAGIVIDTNNFMNKTGVRTFEAAAYLRRNGADVTRVRKMFRDNMADYKAKAETVSLSEVFEDAFAISVCPGKNIESPTIIGAQAANELLDIVGIKASIVLTEYQNQIYVSARSIDEVNVQVIMERLGGGGHLSAAGAQLKGMTLEEAKQLVKDTIHKMIEEGDL